MTAPLVITNSSTECQSCGINTWMEHIHTYDSFINEAAKKQGSLSSIDLFVAFTNLVDGLDGIISEEGELSDRYWKEDVQSRIDSYNDLWGKKAAIEAMPEEKVKALKTLCDDIIDGLEGWESEGNSLGRYFKAGVIYKVRTILGK